MGRAPWPGTATDAPRPGHARRRSLLVGIVAVAFAGAVPSPLAPVRSAAPERAAAAERPAVRPADAARAGRLEAGPARAGGRARPRATRRSEGPPVRAHEGRAQPRPDRGPAPVPAGPATAPPVTVPPRLPVPAPLPDPAERVALVEVGRIRIPRIGVDEVIREGVQQMVIDAGVAHWPGTPAPGGWGNAVLAGHRSTHTAPFLRLGELVAGDLIELADATGSYRYRVTGLEVVGADALWIVDQRPGHHLTIFTCHPIGSAAQRLVVRAELTGPPRP